MKSLPVKVILFILILCLSGCQKIEEVVLTLGGDLSTPEYAPTPVRLYSTPLPEFEPMQFAWFYKPPNQQANLGALAANFSLVIFTRNDESEREILREMDYQGDVLQYLRFEAIMDTGNCEEKPFQNQVAHLEGDFCQIESQHPDWFLRDINGNTINYDHSEYILMDPGNLNWQAYYLEKVRVFQQDDGWQGVFLDNVDASLGRFERQDLLLQMYPDDQSYQAAVKSFLNTLYTGFFTSNDKLLYANIPYLKNPEVWFQYLEYLDGAMLEAFAVDWENGYLDIQEWLNQLNLAERTQAMGKEIILVTQGNMDDQQRMQFGLASFLLVNNGKAYFRYSSDSAYRDLWWYPQFEIDLGQPLGPRYAEGDNWRRDFQYGYVIVDPAGHSSEINTN